MEMKCQTSRWPAGQVQRWAPLTEKLHVQKIKNKKSERKQWQLHGLRSLIQRPSHNVQTHLQILECATHSVKDFVCSCLEAIVKANQANTWRHYLKVHKLAYYSEYQWEASGIPAFQSVNSVLRNRTEIRTLLLQMAHIHLMSFFPPPPPTILNAKEIKINHAKSQWEREKRCSAVLVFFHALEKKKATGTNEACFHRKAVPQGGSLMFLKHRRTAGIQMIVQKHDESRRQAVIQGPHGNHTKTTCAHHGNRAGEGGGTWRWSWWWPRSVWSETCSPPAAVM